MHAVGIKKTLVEKHPWFPVSIYKAFVEARRLAIIDLTDVNALMVTLPWLDAEARETMAVMGNDFWRYGVNESRHDIEALTQYAFEQGLTERKVSVEEMFAPSVRDYVQGVISTGVRYSDEAPGSGIGA